jgi:hypothetical protein
MVCFCYTIFEVCHLKRNLPLKKFSPFIKIEVNKMNEMTQSNKKGWDGLAATHYEKYNREIGELDLQAAGITTIIWASGYSFDFSLVHLPVFDPDGFPIQERGVTAYPGVYFVGLPWLYQQKSGLLLGVGEDAEFITSIITGVPYVPDNHSFPK